MGGVKLTPRMLAVADLVPEGVAVADVGCDHAYVSIYLCTEKKCSKVLAMDVRKGPLEIASRNVAEAGLSDKIELRLSDGLQKIEVGEIDTVVLAGMGGLLMVDILDSKKNVVVELETLVLQPQSDIPAVRSYVHEIGFAIKNEVMIWDEDKPYFMMQCQRGEQPSWSEVEYQYGKCLLETKSEGLYAYLLKENKTQSEIMERLSKGDSVRVAERKAALLKEMELNKQALAYFNGKTVVKLQT